MSKSEVSNKVEETPMNVGQIARYLGRTKAAVYTMHCRGQLPCLYKFAGQLYAFPSEINQCIRRQK